MLEGLYVIAVYSMQEVLTIMILFGIKRCRKRKRDFLTHDDVLHLSEFLYWRAAICPILTPPARRTLVEIQFF